MRKGRLRTSVTILFFLLTVCLTAKFTSEAVKNEFAANGQSAASYATGQVDAIDSFRTERQQLRQMQKSQLNDIIYSDDSDAETIKMAQHQLIRDMDNESMELLLESLLKMRGFEDNAVSVSHENVNVLIRKDILSQQEIAVIYDMVVSETGFSGGNVKIIPIN